MPPLMAPLWNAFCSLHESRGSNGHTSSAITWQEMAAWQQVTGQSLSPWEIEVLRALDAVAIAAFAKQAKAQQAAQNKGT